MPDITPIKKRFFKRSIAKTPEARMALKTLSSNILALRKRHELSQAELAERAGCSRSVIDHVENARIFPSLPLYVALCRSLGVPKPPLV